MCVCVCVRAHACVRACDLSFEGLNQLSNFHKIWYELYASGSQPSVYFVNNSTVDVQTYERGGSNT